MFTAGELAEHQADAEALMVDTFQAAAPSTGKVGGLTETTMVDQYQTPGRIVGRSREGDTDTRTVKIGGVDRPVLAGGLHIPVGKPLPHIGWEFTCTATGAGSDPTGLGRSWRVVDVPGRSYATARRLDVVEVTP